MGIRNISLENPSGRDLRLSIQSDERLTDLKVELTVQGQPLATHTVADFTISTGHNYTLNTQANQDGNVRAEIVRWEDANGDTGSGESASVDVDTSSRHQQSSFPYMVAIAGLLLGLAALAIGGYAVYHSSGVDTKLTEVSEVSVDTDGDGKVDKKKTLTMGEMDQRIHRLHFVENGKEGREVRMEDVKTILADKPSLSEVFTKTQAKKFFAAQDDVYTREQAKELFASQDNVYTREQAKKLFATHSMVRRKADRNDVLTKKEAEEMFAASKTDGDDKPDKVEKNAEKNNEKKMKNLCDGKEECRRAEMRLKLMRD